MSRFTKEHLKSIIIYILIITGLLQVGILWNYQNQGTPTGFLSGLFSRERPISGEVARSRLFVPDRLILSDGDKSHWIMKKGRDGYDELWEEIVEGLLKIGSEKSELAEAGEEWGVVAEKRGYIIDFGFVVEPELLRWFLGAGYKPVNVPAFQKLMVKRDIIDENTAAYYFYGKDGKVYVSPSIQIAKAANFKKMLQAVSAKSATEYREYYTFRSGKIGKVNDEPDILYVSSAPKYFPYNEYMAKLPVKAEKKEELAAAILGNEKGRYNNSTDGENTIQFTYGSNIYRYYADGYLTYRFLGNADISGKGDVGEALLNAYKFVAKIKDFNGSNVDLVLAHAKEAKQGVYEFCFDYRLDGMPVKMEAEMKDGSGRKLSHAVSIQADVKRVLSCDWIIRDFMQDGKKYFNDRFTDLLNNSGYVFRDMSISDIRSGYYCGYNSDPAYDESLKPMLLIGMKGREDVYLEMTPEKGD